jgi:hypothetical protein
MNRGVPQNLYVALCGRRRERDKSGWSIRPGVSQNARGMGWDGMGCDVPGHGLGLGRGVARLFCACARPDERGGGGGESDARGLGHLRLGAGKING